MAIAKTNDIINSLKNMSNEMTMGQLQQVSSGVFSSVANSLIVSLIVINYFKKYIHMVSKDLSQRSHLNIA